MVTTNPVAAKKLKDKKTGLYVPNESTSRPVKSMADILPKCPPASRKPAPVPVNSEGSISNSNAKNM